MGEHAHSGVATQDHSLLEKEDNNQKLSYQCQILASLHASTTKFNGELVTCVN